VNYKRKSIADAHLKTKGHLKNAAKPKEKVAKDPALVINQGEAVSSSPQKVWLCFLLQWMKTFVSSEAARNPWKPKKEGFA
jgi:hypothetical protein